MPRKNVEDLMNYYRPLMEEMVRKGSAVLDRVDPSWRGDGEISSAAFTYFKTCMLGRAYKKKSPEKLEVTSDFGDILRHFRMSIEDARECGFLIDSTPDILALDSSALREFDEQYYSALATLWNREMQKNTLMKSAPTKTATEKLTYMAKL